jgi:glycerol-3-phosphate dehydrogenase
LLSVLKHHFPAHALSEADIVGAQAGLRPLVDAADDPRRASREEAIWDRSERVIAIAGGKLTTYRLMAQRVGDRVAVRLGLAAPSTTDQIPIADATHAAVLFERLKQATTGRPALAAPLIPGWLPSGATVVDAVRHQHARHIDDVLSRRTRLMLLDQSGALKAARRVSQIMARELNWTPAQRQQAMQEFRCAAAQYGLPG